MLIIGFKIENMCKMLYVIFCKENKVKIFWSKLVGVKCCDIYKEWYVEVI